MQDNYGAQYCSMFYIFNEPKPPAWDPDVDAADANEKLMYQLLRQGPAFEVDNQAAWQLLHAAFVGTVGYAWIKDFESSKDGEGAWLALLAHFEGAGKTAARCAEALQVLETEKYYGENVKRFDDVLARRKNAILDLKKLGQEFNDSILVQKLVDSIQVSGTNVDISTMKAMMLQLHRHDYEGAANYASTRIREINPKGSSRRGEAAGAQRRIAKTTIVGGKTIDDIHNIPNDQWHQLSHEQQEDVKRRRKESSGKRNRSRSPGRGGRGRGHFGGRGRFARGRGRGPGRGGRGWYNDRSRGGRGDAERQIGAVQQQNPRADTASSGGAQQQPTNNQQQSGQPSGRGPQNGARFGQSGALRPA